MMKLDENKIKTCRLIWLFLPQAHGVRRSLCTPLDRPMSLLACNSKSIFPLIIYHKCVLIFIIIYLGIVFISTIFLTNIVILVTNFTFNSFVCYMFTQKKATNNQTSIHYSLNVNEWKFHSPKEWNSCKPLKKEWFCTLNSKFPLI